MPFPRPHPGRTLLHALTFMSGFRFGNALSQTYCSSENTGSSYQDVTNIYNSNGACHDQCIDDYAFAVVQYQSCWCSNYIPADQENVSECSTACPGYPDESCGNSDSGLFGYIQLSISPSGTAGGSSSASSTQASSSSSPSSTTSHPSSVSASSAISDGTSDSTVYSSVPVTVFSTVSQTPSVIVSYVTISSTPSSTTTSSTSTTSTSSSTTSFTLTSTSEAAVAAPTSGSSWTRTTVVSTQVLTISGAPVTQTVTSTPMVVKPGADTQDATRKQSVSGGTIAGAVVGSLVGVALILAGVFFLWRRRRSSPSDTGSTASASARRKMERNTSVLSKTGLLAAAGAGAGNDVEKSSYDPAPPLITTSTNNRHSAMYQSSGPSPVSPVGAGAFDNESQRSRRNSRPLVYDQRLNPHAIMSNWEANGSRVSIGTMQDQRDYSRPLGVTNPDPVDD